VTFGSPLVPTSIGKIGSQMGGGSIGATNVFAQYHSGVVSSRAKTKVVSKERARQCAMDKVMKRLGIELTREG
jgi:hypothetical protein